MYQTSSVQGRNQLGGGHGGHMLPPPFLAQKYYTFMFYTFMFSLGSICVNSLFLPLLKFPRSAPDFIVSSLCLPLAADHTRCVRAGVCEPVLSLDQQTEKTTLNDIDG